MPGSPPAANPPGARRNEGAIWLSVIRDENDMGRGPIHGLRRHFNKAPRLKANAIRKSVIIKQIACAVIPV